MLGRKPLTIVEIDIDWCALTYGAGACTAVLGTTGARKCYNTYATCQAKAAFAREPLTLRFAYNQDGLPVGPTIFPALQSVSTRPAEINLSGIDPRTTALGRRASVTVVLQDFAYHDTLTDKYHAERISGAAQADGQGYRPEERGLFFTRLKARWPYYLGRAMRVREGFVGDDIEDMPTRHYVIAEWRGPDASGRVTVVAKDALDLADNKRAQCPQASRGKLAEDIDDMGAILTLTPEGIGDEYPASGRVSISNEIMTFTRAGDVLTITGRGVDGTEAEGHSAGDLVQVCARWEGARPSQVLYDLLAEYAGVNPAFLPLAEWQALEQRWIASLRFTRTIPKPVGVATLIGEICQHGLMIWWDEVNQRVEFQPNRPLDVGQEYYVLSDDASIISAEIDYAEDQRISQMDFWHGLIDPTESTTEGRNYRRVAIAKDPGAESDQEYGQVSLKTIHSPWLGPLGNDVAASVISTRLRNRYRNVPVILTAVLDVKDKPALQLGSLIEVHSRLITGADGTPVPLEMQVSAVEEIDSGSRIRIRAETYTFAERYGVFTEASRPDYISSTPEQRRRGFYWASGNPPKMSNGDDPYRWF